jgi:Scramblase
VLTPLAHRVDILLRAFEPRTHAPIGLIADPASEVPPLGLLLAAHTEEDTLYAAVHGNFASYHVQCGHRPIMLFRPNVRTAIRVTGVVAGVALRGVQGRLTSAVEGLDKVGHARFGLEAGGQRLGSVHAESVKEWNFNVQDPAGTEIARITKTWAGWVKERFTKADHYVVQMHRPLEEPLRSLVIAAALAIDVELKQRGDQTRGSSFWGTRRYD